MIRLAKIDVRRFFLTSVSQCMAGLENLSRCLLLQGPATVQMHQQTVMDSLKDADISVRRKALGLLYVLADESNAQDIVGELVLNLSSAEAAIKEDMVVKIAIMAEKYSLSVGEFLRLSSTLDLKV